MCTEAHACRRHRNAEYSGGDIFAGYYNTKNADECCQVGGVSHVLGIHCVRWSRAHHLCTASNACQACNLRADCHAWTYGGGVCWRKGPAGTGGGALPQLQHGRTGAESGTRCATCGVLSDALPTCASALPGSPCHAVCGLLCVVFGLLCVVLLLHVCGLLCVVRGLLLCLICGLLFACHVHTGPRHSWVVVRGAQAIQAARVRATAAGAAWCQLRGFGVLPSDPDSAIQAYLFESGTDGACRAPPCLEHPVTVTDVALTLPPLAAGAREGGGAHSVTFGIPSACREHSKLPFLAARLAREAGTGARLVRALVLSPVPLTTRNVLCVCGISVASRDIRRCLSPCCPVGVAVEPRQTIQPRTNLT